jgi:hypothetical protein
MVHFVLLGLAFRIVASIVSFKIISFWHNPSLYESKRLFPRIGFGMFHSISCRHKLDGSSPQTLTISHAIFVSQLAVHNVRHDFHVAMRMSAKPTFGLNQIIVHDPQNSKAAVLGVVILRERKVKAALQPIFVRPCWIITRIRAVSEPFRINKNNR